MQPTNWKPFNHSGTAFTEEIESLMDRLDADSEIDSFGFGLG